MDDEDSLRVVDEDDLSPQASQQDTMKPPADVEPAKSLLLNSDGHDRSPPRQHAQPSTSSNSSGIEKPGSRHNPSENASSAGTSSRASGTDKSSASGTDDRLTMSTTDDESGRERNSTLQSAPHKRRRSDDDSSGSSEAQLREGVSADEVESRPSKAAKVDPEPEPSTDRALSEDAPATNDDTEKKGVNEAADRTEGDIDSPDVAQAADDADASDDESQNSQADGANNSHEKSDPRPDTDSLSFLADTAMLQRTGPAVQANHSQKSPRVGPDAESESPASDVESDDASETNAPATAHADVDDDDDEIVEGSDGRIISAQGTDGQVNPIGFGGGPGKGSKPYECAQCPKSFPSLSKLVRHSRVHTRERPFECEICHTRFTQKSSLKTHLKKHQKSMTTGENGSKRARVLPNEAGSRVAPPSAVHDMQQPDMTMSVPMQYPQQGQPMMAHGPSTYAPMPFPQHPQMMPMMMANGMYQPVMYAVPGGMPAAGAEHMTGGAAVGGSPKSQFAGQPAEPPPSGPGSTAVPMIMTPQGLMPAPNQGYYPVPFFSPQSTGAGGNEAVYSQGPGQMPVNNGQLAAGQPQPQYGGPAMFMPGAPPGMTAAAPSTEGHQQPMHANYAANMYSRPPAAMYPPMGMHPAGAAVMASTAGQPMMMPQGYVQGPEGMHSMPPHQQAYPPQNVAGGMYMMPPPQQQQPMAGKIEEPPH